MAIQCVKCGFDNPIGVNVCGQCAAALARACGNCGFENPVTFKFCGNCGANVLGAPLPRNSDQDKLARLQSAMPATLAEKITRVGKQIEGERRAVTVLFADISGFTGLAEKLDPEEVYNLIDGTFKSFIDEIYRHEGTLDKFMGDGVMALFGAPVAHEDDPARAVRAALGMQSALSRSNEDLETRLGISLKVRIGLNSGPVVVGSVGSDLRMDYTALGDTVNVASRLQNVAEPGTILVSRPVYEQTLPFFEFRELGSIRVKGRLEPVEIFEAVAPLQKRGRVRGIPGLVAPMVGRAAELLQLRTVVEELTSDRRGRIVLVTGDAGIGKTRLTTEIKVNLFDKPVTILEGACLSYGQSAYEVFLRLLRGYFEISENDAENVVRTRIERTIRRVLVDGQQVARILPYIENLLSIQIVEKELAERVRHLEPAQLQQQTFLAVRDLFIAEAQQQPLVLIFEDVHWADKLSLDLLTFMLGAAEQVPLLLYFISRPNEGQAASQIQTVASANHPSSFLHLALEPLSQADCLALIDLLLSIAELPESLKQLIPERAEGNPFYLEEIIRMLIDRGIICRTEGHWQVAPGAEKIDLQVPGTLQGLIMARVDDLSEGARQAIQCAAVIGRGFTRKLLSEVLEDARNLEADLQELEDRELIRRVQSGPDPEYRFHNILIEETVYNSLLIRRRERLHHKIAEGIETLFKGRLEDHIEQLAFHNAESKNADRALPYLIRAGKRAAERFANNESLRYYLLAADCLTQTRPTTEERIDVYAGLGNIQTFIGDYDGALNSHLIALETIRTAGQAEGLRPSAEIMRRIGRIHERRGDYTEALHWLQGALNALDRDPNSAKTVERMRTYNDIGWVHHRRGQFEEAYQWQMRTLQIAEGTDHYNEMASAYNRLVVLFRERGDWTRALAYAEKGLRLREAIGDSYGLANSHTNLGVIAWDQGDWNKALYHFEQSLEIKEKIGDIEGVARLNNNLGELYRAKGDYVRAMELGQKALAIGELIKSGRIVLLALNNLAYIKLLQGQFEGAILDLNRSLNTAIDMGSRELQADTQRLLGEAYLGEKQMDQASHAALQALTITTEIGNRLIEGQVLRTLGRISFAKADLAGAGRHFQASLSIFSNLKNPFELAETQAELALLECMRGHSSQARQLLETACATFERLGAETEIQRARTEVGALTSPAADSVPPAE